MNFTQFASSAATRAQSHQECTECFEPLCSKPVVCLCNNAGKRSCSHIFHQECVDVSAVPLTCHLCMTLFQKVVVMPNPTENPEAWFRFVDYDGNGSLSYDEIMDGLKSQLKLDWRKIEMDIDGLWTKWDGDRSNSVSMAEFLDPVNGVIAYLKTHYAPTAPTRPMPDIRKDKRGWFEYWDEDRTGSLDKSEVCRALIKTFRQLNIDRHAVSGTLDVIWPIFDEDNSGHIELGEFCSRDNLADTIIAQLTQ